MAGVALVLVIFMMVADIGRRQAVGRSIPGILESSEVLVVAIVFLGMALAQRNGDHVAVNILVVRLRGAGKFAVELLGAVIMLVIVLWLTWATFESGLSSFERREFRHGLVPVPIWPARLAIPLGFAALSIEAAVDVWYLIRRYVSRRG